PRDRADGRPPLRHEGLGKSNARATRGEACRDAGKTVRISVAVPSTAGFDRLLPDEGNLPLHEPVKRAILTSKSPGSGECRIKAMVERGEWMQIDGCRRAYGICCADQERRTMQ